MEYRENFAAGSMEVTMAELLVATADSADNDIDAAVSQVLRMLREKMHMDVVFVSEFVGGRRVFRQVAQVPGHEVIAVGQSDPLEDSWCQRVVDGRMPEMAIDSTPLQASGQAPATPYPVGTYLSTPVKLPSGEVYGTLCCLSFGINEGITGYDLKRLQYTAQLTGQKIARSRQQAGSGHA